MKKLEAFSQKYLTRKNLFIFTSICFLISIIPLLYLTRYTLPFYDDYNYGRLTAAAWSETGSIIEVIKAALQQVKTTYNNWQGTYTGIFFMAISPGIFSESLYPIGLIFNFLLFSGSMLFFIKVLLVDNFKMEKYGAGIIALFVLFLSIQFTPGANEGFFWYNGGIYYTGTFSIILLLFSMLLITARTKKKSVYITLGCLSILASFLIGGSNFIAGILCFSSLFLLLIYRIFMAKSKWLFPLLSFITLTVAFLFNVMAPGNKVRQEYFEPMSPISAVLSSLERGIKVIGVYINVPIIIMFLVILPLIYEATTKSNFSFKYPPVVTIITYLVFCSQFTPTYYATGDSSAPKRVNHVIFLASIIFVFLNLLYWCGWVSKRSQAKVSYPSTATGSAVKAVVALTLLCVFAFNVIGMTLINKNSLTSISAVRSIRNGEAAGFYNERHEQIEMLKDPDILDVEFEPHKYRPHLLYFTNLSNDPDASPNRYTAEYYHKNSVLCKKD